MQCRRVKQVSKLLSAPAILAFTRAHAMGYRETQSSVFHANTKVKEIMTADVEVVAPIGWERDEFPETYPKGL